MDAFRKAIDQVLKHEGGYVNDPRDPGGETNMGISKRAFPAEDIPNMSKERAAELYRTHYWVPAKVDLVPPGLQPLYFDTAVNCGVRTAVMLLQMAAGAVADGRFGPVTAEAAQNVTPKMYAAQRMRFYGRIIKRNPVLARYLKGWTRRVNDYLK